MSKYRLGKLSRTRADGTGYWSYCVSWHEPTGRKRYSLGTTDRLTAERLAKDFWTKRQVGQHDTVGAILSLYLDALPKGSKDEKRKREAWTAAAPFWSSLRICHIDTHTSQDYIAWRQRAANTVRNELGMIRHALGWAKERKLYDCERPPIKLPAMPASKTPHLTKAQFAAFLEGCAAPHVALFAQLAVLTGARSTALLQLRWDKVDLDRRILDLNAEGVERKANKSRAVVPINDRLLPLLVAAKAGAITAYVIEHHGAPLASIKKGIAAASVRSGVRCHPHMFRHSAAVWMAEARVPMAEIAAFLGHRDSRITERVYARFHPDYLQRAASALDWET